MKTDVSLHFILSHILGPLQESHPKKLPQSAELLPPLRPHHRLLARRRSPVHPKLPPIDRSRRRVSFFFLRCFHLRVNPSGTPFFKGMMQRLEARARTPLIGYCNGDLLFASSFVRSLAFLLDKIRQRELNSKVPSFFLSLMIDSHRRPPRQRPIRREQRAPRGDLPAGRVHRGTGRARLAVPDGRRGLLHLLSGDVSLGRAGERCDWPARLRQLSRELRVLPAAVDLLRGCDQRG